jgi:hypothetical protein
MESLRKFSIISFLAIGLGFGFTFFIASTMADQKEKHAAPVAAEPGTALYYAYECEAELGPLPHFSCLDCIEIPITQKGVRVTEDVDWCDNPAIFGDPCQVGNRVGRVQGMHENGDPRPEVSFLMFCRDGGIGVIGHNSETGATCFFSIKEGGVNAYGFIPGPRDPGYDDAWQSPQVVADDHCVSCHMADPFLHTPWIDQVKDPKNPSDTLVPMTGSLASPYFVVGDEFYQPAVGKLLRNDCTRCHRGQCSSMFNGNLEDLYVPGSFWEDHYDETMAEDLEALKAWCHSLDLPSHF